MKSCIINLEALDIANREHFVFYASDTHIIYKNENNITVSNCAGDIIQNNPAPAITKKYEIAYHDDIIALLFENKTLVFMSTDGVEYYHHDISDRQLGKIVTKIHFVNNNLLFGTAHYSSFQFVLYDRIIGTRISQSLSQQNAFISNIFLGNNAFYVIHDKTLLHCYDLQTCENLWRRFEVGNINGNVLEHDGKILYVHQNKIKIMSAPNSVDTVTVPLKKIDTLLGAIKSDVYFTHNGDKNVGCFNLKTSTVKWDMSGQEKIDDHIFIKGRNKTVIHDILLVRIRDNLGILDITDGRLLYFINIPQMYNMTRTENCVLLHKYDGTTDILPGY